MMCAHALVPRSSFDLNQGRLWGLKTVILFAHAAIRMSDKWATMMWAVSLLPGPEGAMMCGFGLKRLFVLYLHGRGLNRHLCRLNRHLITGGFALPTSVRPERRNMYNPKLGGTWAVDSGSVYSCCHRRWPAPSKAVKQQTGSWQKGFMRSPILSVILLLMIIHIIRGGSLHTAGRFLQKSGIWKGSLSKTQSNN